MTDTPRFGVHPQAFFETVYAATPPWDIGDVQPDLAALLQAHPPEGPALDLGCGPGDHAIHLARLGLQTTGIDFVGAAIVTAWERAAAQPDDVRALLEFLRADARRPSDLARRFRTVLDSGFLHVFEPHDGRAIVEDVTRVLEPGGRYYLLALAVDFGLPGTPRRIGLDELPSLFPADRGWRVIEAREAVFTNRIAAPVAATAACVAYR